MFNFDPHTTEHVGSANDIVKVIATNGVVFLVANYATPLISFCTASLSLYYIIRKIKKEFFSDPYKN